MYTSPHGTARSTCTRMLSNFVPTLRRGEEVGYQSVNSVTIIGDCQYAPQQNQIQVKKIKDIKRPDFAGLEEDLKLSPLGPKPSRSPRSES